MEKHSVRTQYHRAGEPGDISLGVQWMPEVWLMREEMREQTLESFIDNFCERLRGYNRFEIGVYRVTDRGEIIVAAAVVAFDADPHVGLTLSVEVAYSTEPGCGKLLMREFHNIAHLGGAKTLRLVKRIGAYSYNVRYAKVRVNHGN